MRPRQPAGATGAILSACFSNGTALTIESLSRRALTIRRSNGVRPPPHPADAVDVLSFGSSYPRPDRSGLRGYSNWLVPDRIMVGQYPGQTPEKWGPTVDQAEEYTQSLVRDAGVTTFCCLQSEVPSQDDESTWAEKGGEVFLSYPDRIHFPRSFTRYSPTVLSECSRVSAAASETIPRFLHAPVKDLNVPDSAPLLELLSLLLDDIEDDRCIYLHCWGGRGRAGLVGACLVSLLFPELDGKAVLDLVQAGYDTREGAEYMPQGLKRSPQTDDQRAFVARFVQERRRLSRKESPA